MERIGLFGGSFDPVHCGHLLVARAAMEELDLARVFFIPAAQSPFKPESKPAPAALRARLLRLALAGESRWELDPQEMDRGGTSYTIDTARKYRQLHPQSGLFYLIGADHVATLPEWRDADALASLLEFVVIPRPGEPVGPAPAPFRARVLKGFPLGVSSSQIRKRAAAGQSLEGLVPSLVAQVIANEGLYQ